jgi:hypothetical protein
MSINDVQHELNNIKKAPSVHSKNSNDLEKEFVNESDNDSDNDSDNIKSILKKNIRNLESFVEGKVINMYARPWNKLEPKLKRYKINEYLKDLLVEKKLNLIIFNNLIYQLHKEIEFNRKINLTYDKEKCVIIEFDYDTYL